MSATILFSDRNALYAPTALVGSDDLRIETLDADDAEGVLIESSLERIAVFSWNEDRLSLADVGRLRRTTARVHARRAIVYVRKDAELSIPVLLLATLSKMEILRLPSERADS
jgi:hypothetical protein